MVAFGHPTFPLPGSFDADLKQTFSRCANSPSPICCKAVGNVRGASCLRIFVLAVRAALFSFQSHQSRKHSAERSARALLHSGESRASFESADDPTSGARLDS